MEMICGLLCGGDGSLVDMHPVEQLRSYHLGGRAERRALINLASVVDAL